MRCLPAFGSAASSGAALSRAAIAATLAATLATAGLSPTALHAQERVTLWNSLSLDRLVQSALNGAIGMVRSQMDLQYGDLAVDLRRSRVTMTDIKAWPLMDWDVYGECVIGIDRISVVSTPIYALDKISFRGRIAGLSLPRGCFPKTMQEVLGVVELDRLEIPRLTFDIDYGMPKSDALFRVFADATGVGSVDLTADFSYFWFDGREDMDNPKPVFFLSEATLALENKGLWEVLKPTLPPAFTGAEGGDNLADMLVVMMEEGNGADALPDPDGMIGNLNPAQESFAASVAEVWDAFLANPDMLVLQTFIDGDTFLDFAAMEDDLREVFVLLQPEAALAPSRVSRMLATDLLKKATAEDASGLSDDERLQVGRAFVTGDGAPRNIEGGMDLLRPLATAGNGEAALLMAEAMRNAQPEQAYLWALRAGAAGETGAVAMLDRLENALPFARVLELQAEVSGEDSHPGSALASIGAIRDQAGMRLSGKGAARSYGIAAMWAILAKAAGDPEAADMLEEIDGLVRLEDAAARAAWAETEGAYADLAMQVWIGQDLPARYQP